MGEYDSTSRLIIVAYDIPDNTRRRNIAKELTNYGMRVQKSVFECYLTEQQKRKMQTEIAKIVDVEEDHIRYYSLCVSDKKAVRLIGEPIIYKDEEYFLF